MVRILFTDDFPPWEKEYLIPFARALGTEIGGRFEITTGIGEIRPRKGVSATWIISRNWREVARKVGWSFKGSDGRVFLSVFHHSVSDESPFLAFWRRFAPALPKRVTLITHNPMTFRYLSELDNFPRQQLVDLPLSYPDFLEIGSRPERASGIIGTLSDLDGTSNLNFVVLLAHRLIRSNPKLRFRVLGEGPLRGHLEKMARDLNLGDRFDISPVVRISDIVQWDAFVFAPLRCDHLIAPLIGIASEVPTVCMETPGLDEWLGGLTVPLVPLYQTEKMALAVEELIQSVPARTHNRLSLTHGLKNRLQLAKISLLYGRVFGVSDFRTPSREVA